MLILWCISIVSSVFSGLWRTICRDFLWRIWELLQSTCSTAVSIFPSFSIAWQSGLPVSFPKILIQFKDKINQFNFIKWCKSISSKSCCGLRLKLGKNCFCLKLCFCPSTETQSIMITVTERHRRLTNLTVRHVL